MNFGAPGDTIRSPADGALELTAAVDNIVAIRAELARMGLLALSSRDLLHGSQLAAFAGHASAIAGPPRPRYPINENSSPLA